MMENPNTEIYVFIDYFHILAAEWGAIFCFSLEIKVIWTTVNTPLFHYCPSHHPRGPWVLETCFGWNGFIMETIRCWCISSQELYLHRCFKSLVKCQGFWQHTARGYPWSMMVCQGQKKKKCSSFFVFRELVVFQEASLLASRWPWSSVAQCSKTKKKKKGLEDQ